MILRLLYLSTIRSAYALSVKTSPALGEFANASDLDLSTLSIGIAVLTLFLQGFVASVVTTAEDQDKWTFRFRIARYKHVWWTAISVLLSLSFVLNILSVLSGSSNDTLGIFALAAATCIAIVRYAVPAWRNRHFVWTRWLAWTGDSRTAIRAEFGEIVADANWWRRIAQLAPPNALHPSDKWGWDIHSPPGIESDPTSLLTSSLLHHEEGKWGKENLLGGCVYDDGFHHAGGSISLLWGADVGFRPRVSRAINSVPRGLLASRPFTEKGYKGQGLTLAMGILGRNKGLRPFQLVFDYKDARKTQRGIRRQSDVSITAHLENTSVWSPRPNKVLRSCYDREMREQFGTLGEDYVGAATELALIFLDCTPEAAQTWLLLKLEQQSMEVNRLMSGRHSMGHWGHATPEQLQTLYRASYTSMILSLNYFRFDVRGGFVRPDLICFAILWLIEGIDQETKNNLGSDLGNNDCVIVKCAKEPTWWKQAWVGERLNKERICLDGANAEWRNAAAWLLGLASWPTHLDHWPRWETDLSAKRRA